MGLFAASRLLSRNDRELVPKVADSQMLLADVVDQKVNHQNVKIITK